jgi:hypothetical protein
MGRTIVSLAVAALLATSTLAAISASGSCGSSSAYYCGWAYDVPLIYETSYYSGIGPYYSDNIFTSIDDAMHYEEYGFDFDFYATFTASIYLGNVVTGDDYYMLSATAEADVLKITPYKQVMWFARPLAQQMAGNAAEVHAWIGAAYQVATGEAYLSYAENAQTGYGDLWSGGAYTVLTPYSDSTYESSWDDPVYTVNVIDYLPSNVANYITEYQLYEQQLF